MLQTCVGDITVTIELVTYIGDTIVYYSYVLHNTSGGNP